MQALRASSRVTAENERLQAELEEAYDALREIYMMCGNPDPSDGEGTLASEVADSVRKLIPKLIASISHECEPMTSDCFGGCRRCEFEEILTEHPELFEEEMDGWKGGQVSDFDTREEAIESGLFVCYECRDGVCKGCRDLENTRLREQLAALQNK